MRKIDWTTTLFLILTPLFLILFLPAYLYYEGLKWQLVLMFFVMWGISTISITGGYHRYISHKSYDANLWVKLFYLFFGAGTFQGSALRWCTDHRRHHSYVDTEKDPYNINNGFWYAHLGWLFLEIEDQYKNTFAHDLKKDKWIYFQHKYYVPLAIFSGFGVPVFIGLALGMPFGGLVFGALLKIVVTHHCTFFINSLCHTLGRQNYSDRHSARDSLVMAFLTGGEGYHNFHHEFQTDYRNGVRWYHWDPTKWVIRFLAWMGFATRLKKSPSEIIIRAKMIQDEKRLSQRGVATDRLLVLKEKVFLAQDNFVRLKQDYQKFKRELKKQSIEKYLHLKTEMRIAKVEMKKNYTQWRLYVKTLNMIAS